jgi:hypothetical protein
MDVINVVIEVADNNNEDEAEEETILIRGWQLLSIICGLFLPSQSLIHIIGQFLNNNIKLVTNKNKNEKKYDENLTQKQETMLNHYATYSLSRLNTLYQNKSQPQFQAHRCYVPSANELKSILHQSKVEIRVSFLDGSCKQLSIDPQLNAHQLCQKLCRMMNIYAHNCKHFGLYQMTESHLNEPQQYWLAANLHISHLYHKKKWKRSQI